MGRGTPRRPLEEVIYEFLVTGKITLIYYRGTSDIWDIVHVLANKKDICKSEITLAMPYKYGKKVLVKSQVLTLADLIDIYVKGKITLLNGVPIIMPSDTIDENEYYKLLVIDIEVDYEDRVCGKQITTVTFMLQSSTSLYNVILCLGDDELYTLLITNMQTKEDMVNTSLRKDLKILEKIEHKTMESQAVFKKAINTLKQVAKEFYNNCKEM